MNKYKLNWLRWITSDKLSDGTILCYPDETLKTITDVRVEGNKIRYKIKCDVDTSKWKVLYGGTK